MRQVKCNNSNTETTIKRVIMALGDAMVDINYLKLWDNATKGEIREYQAMYNALHKAYDKIYQTSRKLKMGV